jgi:small subunit ribosomal protein S6
MPLYECVLIARNDVTPQQAEAFGDTIATLMTEMGGEVKKREYWGLRSLAYRIKKNRKGHYLLLNLDAPSPAIVEMERQLGLNEDILRYMTVRVDALEEGPSAFLTRRDRDDRGSRFGERGDRPDRGDRPERGERGDRGGDRGPRPGGRFDSGRGARGGYEDDATV